MNAYEILKEFVSKNGCFMPDRETAIYTGYCRSGIKRIMNCLDVYGIARVRHGKSSELLLPVEEWDARIEQVNAITGCNNSWKGLGYDVIQRETEE